MSYRTTKILATIGPAINDHAEVCELLRRGVDGFRFNFSHGTVDEHLEMLEMIRGCCEEQGRSVACLADLQGPKIRIGNIEDDPVDLDEGSTVDLYHQKMGKGEGAFQIPVDYELLLDDVSNGDEIYLNDGQIKLTVNSVEDSYVNCDVVVGGKIWSKKGVNIPTTELSVPALTEKDREQLKVIVEEDFDAVALSFVRRPEDLRPARQIMAKTDSPIDLIAKIESRIALEHLDGIISGVEGIIVARGDLGAEIGSERVPYQQKRMIEQANKRGKFVITATQMLESMIDYPTATRAEVSDVANAILDGSDIVMLSGETAIGDHPLKTVNTMKNIIEATEEDFHEELTELEVSMEDDTETMAVAMCNAAARVARELDASAIVAPTASGSTARFISNTYPTCPVIAPSFKDRTRQKCNLYRNVQPIPLERLSSTEQLAEASRRVVKEEGVAKQTDQIILLTGLPIERKGVTNFLHVLTV